MRNVLATLMILALALTPRQPAQAGRERTIIDLGGPGLETWATGLNDSGGVVGIGAPDLNELIGMRGLWWTHGKVVTLPPLPGDIASRANAINNRGQVVGVSFGGSSGSRAFLFQDDTLYNLNDLVTSDDVLQSAQDINDAGVITGRLRDHVTGQTLMFVATPIASGKP